MDNARIANALRESKALRFVALVDGEARPLATSKTKGRWERLAALAMSLGAECVECHDAAGGVLAVVRVSDVSDEVASVPVPAKTVSTRSELAEVVALIVDSSDRQVARYSASVEAVLGATLRTLEVVTRRMEALDAKAEKALEAREEAVRGDVLALSAVAESVKAEREALEEAVAASREDGTGESDAMVAKLLEPLGAAIAAKVMTGGA